MTEFKEQSGEKSGPRRRRFLKFLRELPHPTVQWDAKTKAFVAKEPEPSTPQP